jgi:hypothetical protein
MQNGANFRFISPVLGGLGIGGDGKNAPKKPATPRRSSCKSRVFKNKTVNRSDICIAGAAVEKSASRAGKSILQILFNMASFLPGRAL